MALIIGIIVGEIDLGIKVYFEYTMSPDEAGKRLLASGI